MKAYMICLTREANELCVVLVSRLKSPNKYTIPRGSVKRYEHCAHAAKREAFEEAGFVTKGDDEAVMPVFIEKRNVYVAYGTLSDNYPEYLVRARRTLPLSELRTVKIPKWQRKMLSNLAKRLGKSRE